MKPVIYCIEAFEYFNPYGHQSGFLDQTWFLVLFSCREGTVQLQQHLDELVEACERHDPGMYLYLQRLRADLEEFHDSDTQLVRELERDGFDFSRLLQVYYDNADLERIAQWIGLHGKNQERRTKEDIQRFMRDEDFLSVLGEWLSKKREVTQRVYEAMKGVVLGYLPTVNLLEAEQLRHLNARLNGYAMAMADWALSKWEKMDLEEDWKEDEEEDDDEEPTSLEGQRRFWLEYRRKNPVAGCEQNPIFCVEIVKFVEEWELRGWNHVNVCYKLTCAEGEWYSDIDLEYLLREALLYFPDIHAAAMKCCEASSSPRPKHPAILHGLQRKGYDLTPVLASYLASNCHFIPYLREEMRLRRLQPDFDDFFAGDQPWEEEAWGPQQVKEFQTVNLLRDDLVTVGIKTILRELPEFHIRVPQSFLDYMEHWSHDELIDPINDFGEELDRAFELKRALGR